MQKLIFPDNFLWGVATAAYQIEGGIKEDGKGESIWDRFSHNKGKIADSNSGDIACDHYHRYPEDIKIMKDLGIKTYRFSISWSRIFPEGKGEPNKKGIEFYRKIINLLLENDIKPAITLFHWDLPQKLQDIGGWANRDVTDYFEQYARLLFKEFGGLVPIWITHNEPSVYVLVGNWEGRHAPGITDMSTALLVSHNLLLAHGKVVKAYREMKCKGEIGITLNMTQMYPESKNKNDIKAAELNDGLWNRWHADPILKGKYPEDMIEWFSNKVVLPEISNSDLKIISTPVDFVGINSYFASKVKYDPKKWPMELSDNFIGEYRTEMGWGINPDGFYDLLVRLGNDYKGIKIYITENGMSYRDMISRNGTVEDDYRIDYLFNYLSSCHKAIKKGVNVAGYFVWSFMDNFEWAEGFRQRFGIVYVDYKTQKRIIKKSGLWYKDVIKNNGF